MRRLRQAPAIILFAAVGLLAVQGTATWMMIERDRIDEQDTAGRTVTRALAVAEANINRGLLQADAMLAGIDKLVTIPQANHSATGANRALRALSDQSFLTRDLMIVDGMGRVRAARLGATVRRPPPLTEEFLPARLTEGTLRIVGPVRNRATGEWSLYLGRFVGRGREEPLSAVAELPVSNLARVALPDLSSPGLRVSAQRADGQLLMSNPHAERHIGKTLAPVALRLPVNRQWTFSTDSIDGSRVIAAAAPTLYAGLSVVAEIREEDALAGWRERRTVTLAVSSALGLLLLLAALSGALYIRARERAAADIRRAKHLLDQALDSMSEGFVLWGSDRRLSLANRRYYEMFPFLRDVALPGARFDGIIEHAAKFLLPESSDKERRSWRGWRSTAHERLHSYELELPDGTIVESNQARTPDGSVVSVYRDVTLRRKAEARLDEAKLAAERAHRMKSEFLSNMSHELRTPLNAIIGFAQVLELGNPRTGPATVLEYARDIRISGEHLLSIINDVLDMSKLEAGTMMLRESEFDLGRIVLQWTQILREQAREKGLDLQVEVPREPLPLRGDERLLRQVLLNLVSNAIKFTESGGTIRVGADRTGDGGFRITVADTGIGIAPEHTRQVFEPFFQVESASTRRFSGTGLGLSISLAIVNLHEGTLTLDSPSGKGTVATVMLPERRKAAAPQPGVVEISSL
ncbi:ATP-binding protein [Azospirillum sp. SYSU D00513]|uniref:sensor histidine kinase n=1 Tax=Azospirillum sp. SYSU D00513 TaxID=2812561 RepID=UPI001A974CCA|nr:ATP-binding protein [Azospirillum sp. SYSU D00513]